MSRHIMNRWWVVFGAVLVQICIGAIYSWSLFNQPLSERFGWSTEEVLVTYSIAIFVFAFTTIFSGRLQDRIGPRIVTTIGGILYGAGLLVASQATSLPVLYLGYGVLSGIGVGFVYVCPLSTCLKWFPEKKGFITGIAVGAFGAGSLVFKSVIVRSLAARGVSDTFFFLGLLYMVIVITGAQFLRVPGSAGATDRGTKPLGKALPTAGYGVGQMVRTKTFGSIWIVYLLACMPGLLVIGLAKDIGVELVGLSAVAAANSVSVIALFNASGRIFWGSLSDRAGRVKVLYWMFGLTALSLIALSLLTASAVVFYASLAGIAFNFGGFLAVFPALTGDYFGLENVGANYGVVYQAYGFAALLGPLVEGLAGGLVPTFLIAAGFAALGGLLTLTIKRPPARPVHGAVPTK